MARFIPLDGYRYTAEAGNLSHLVCPPYDIISSAQKEELEKKHPYNFIHLELPGGEDPYRTAKNRLADWKKSGILKKDDPSFYFYELQYEWEGTCHSLTGVIGRAQLEEKPGQGILRHETTLSGAKEDRYLLLKETGCQFSPIICLYQDPEGQMQSLYKKVKQKMPLSHFLDSEGVSHSFWRVKTSEEVEQISRFMEDQSLLIADGHHRYETALRYYRDVKTPRSGYAMMMLFSAQSPSLLVLPTHRVLRSVQNFSAETFLKQAEESFELCRVQNLTEGKTLLKNTPSSFLFLYSGNRMVLLKEKNGRVNSEDVYRELDVVKLQERILTPYFSMDRRSFEDQEHLFYTRDAKEAWRMVNGGEADCVFLLRSTEKQDIFRVAQLGKRLPQKSTYFYPKPLCGFTFYDMID